jgi:hypothetical protein
MQESCAAFRSAQLVLRLLHGVMGLHGPVRWSSTCHYLIVWCTDELFVAV